jgi:hypothetical protein
MTSLFDDPPASALPEHMRSPTKPGDRGQKLRKPPKGAIKAATPPPAAEQVIEQPADQSADVVEAADAGGLGALVVSVQANPITVFTDGKAYSEFAAKIREQVGKFVPDLSTPTSRKAIATEAFKVTKAKTSLDAAGKKLTEEARATITAVNATRNLITTELDALAKEVRKPLTDWEAAEQVRIDANGATIAQMRRDMVIADDDTAATVRSRGYAIGAMTFAAPQWTEDEAATAVEWQRSAIGALVAGCKRLEQVEAERAELEQLRAQERQRQEEEAAKATEEAAAERARRDNADRLAAIRQRRLRLVADGRRAQQAERDRAEAERQRIAAAEAQAERDRVARVARLRERRLRAVADGRRAQREAAHAAELAEQRAQAQKIADAAAAERAKEVEAERQREAERQKERDAQIARDAEAARLQRIADEAAQRAEDQAHRDRVKAVATKAIMKAGGVDEDAAAKIVQAIVAGDVPQTTVVF